MNNSRILFCIFMFLICLFPVNIFSVKVYADVPGTLDVEPWTSETDTILNITVRHLGPTSSHYINTVQVEIDGIVNDLNLNPQTTDPFTIQYNMGELISEPSIRVRAHCIVHGYGSWSATETISEFESTNLIIIFVGLSALIVLLISKIKAKPKHY